MILMMTFFTSLKTTLWLTGLSMAVFLAGSVSIPGNLDVFSEINDMPLFQWLWLNRMYPDKIFWIYLLLVLMTLLATATLLCSVDALRKGLSRRTFVETLSPQVLHMGVVIVLFGHLVSAASGYKQDVSLKLGETREVRGRTLTLDSVDFTQVRGEDSTHWAARLVLDGKAFTLEPARPAFFGRVGYFLKSAQQLKNNVIIGIVYDPGVLFEIMGAIVFVAGSLGLFSLQLRNSNY